MKRVCVTLSLAACLSLATNFAHADPFFTQQATVAFPGGALPTVVRINGNGGATYINTLSPTGGVGAGSAFVGIGAVPITNINNAAGGTIVPSFGANTTGVAIFGLSGVITSLAAGNVSVQFNAGAAMVTSVPLNSFNTGDPSTWGLANPVLGSYVLATPANIAQGNINATAGGFPAATINTQTVNLASLLQQQGRLLFSEVGNDPLITVTTFDPFAAGNVLPPEQLFIDLAETIQNPAAAAFNIDAGDLVALNAIALAKLGAGAFFATGLGGGANQYDPGNIGTSVDFPTAFQIIGSPGVQFQFQQVPEPTSILVWGLVAGTIGIGRAMRRSRK